MDTNSILKELEEKFTFTDIHGVEFIIGDTSDKLKYWLKEKLTAFEKSVKEEFLKRILPGRESSDYGEYDEGFNDCREEIIANANKEGINICQY